MTRLRTVAANEDGFTLIEMMVAAVTGTIVILAAFGLIDASNGLSLKVGDRVDVTQRARDAMEQVTRELRSQVCMKSGSSAIVDGQDNSITFYTWAGTGPFAPERHTITWSPVNRTLVDYAYAGIGTFPDLTYPAQPTRVTTLLPQVDALPTAPIFSYYTWATSGTVAPSLRLPTPLSTGDAIRTVRIVVQFQVSPTRASNSGQSAVFQDEVFARTSDPNNSPSPGLPDCG